MERIFSTRDVHQRERFAYWKDVACRTLVDHDSAPQDGCSFHADMDAGRLADIGMVLFENSPMEVQRTLLHVSRAKTDDLFLCRQLSGALTIQHEGREVSIGLGDMTLLDPMLPYDARFFAGSKLLVLKLQRRELEARVGKTGQMIARLLNSSGTTSGLTSAFVGLLPEHVGRMSRDAELIVRDQTLDLIAVSLAESLESNIPRLSNSRMLALLKVRTVIDARLTDPDLDVGMVAAAAGLSVRYANTVLAQIDSSVSHLIRTRRLERCRAAFEDPKQRPRTISEIAYGWGFSDMTHFGRAFKEAYGMSPRDYRRLHDREAYPGPR
jgi:AraC family transcriptional regulator, positive regulator of tynA and feaB